MPSRNSRKAKAPNIDTSLDNLVIVESPAKAKTIKKYLGKGFEVVASMGHIRDLPKKEMGVDIEHDFQPHYEISPDKKAVVRALKNAAKTMKIWLATDEDREGEAIARHVSQVLNLDIDKTPRIVFHEITKDALQYAIKNPRYLDLKLVDAQQARRILDRLVGFELSPVLRKKIKTGLSAGRVQSVAVRLLVEREREILGFTPKISFKIGAEFLAKNKETFSAERNKNIEDYEQVKVFLEGLRDKDFLVKEIEQKPGTKNPSAPFITSTLQQEASRKLGFSVARTMQLAQKLYESGHITYMRTDSFNLSKQAIASAVKTIESKFGKDYVQTRIYAKKAKGAQEAHEAIRPTKMHIEYAGSDESQKKLYHLIWQRTLASQMASAKVEKTVVSLQPSPPAPLSKREGSHQGDGGGKFIAKGEVIVFDGFLKIYGGKALDDVLLPPLKVGDRVTYKKIIAQEHRTKAPARYGEASLVKKMEELGIGRPSTYAPTIETIQRRGYVEKKNHLGEEQFLQEIILHKKEIKEKKVKKKIGAYKNKLVPTDIGMIVTDFLLEYFGNILDYQFTAKVEEEFDHIAQGKLQWQKMIAKFYTPFHKNVEEVLEHAKRESGERVLGTDPKTGKVVKVRIGRFGPLVQIGDADDEEKQFASLKGDYSIATITLDQALSMFDLPRILGERKGKPIKSNSGRFGPYVQRGDVFASLKDEDPCEITFERAKELIEARIERDKARTLKSFEYKGKDGRIVIGRWKRHEIRRNRKTIRLPKEMDGAKLTQEKIEKLIENELGTKKKTRKRRQ